MRLLFALVIALSFARPAYAQDARVWIFDDNPEAPALGFGLPESDDILIAFSCEPDAKRMSIVETAAAQKLVPGRAASFRLTAGAMSLDLAGDAIANETDGTVSIEVAGPPNPRVFALLKAGPSLTIEVMGEKVTIPLAGAAPHVATFERLCFGRR